MKEINISLITGQLITLLPIWEIDSRLEYITIYIGTTLLIYLLILAVKKKNPVAATTRFGEKTSRAYKKVHKYNNT